jgi:hypothetical protein
MPTTSNKFDIKPPLGADSLLLNARKYILMFFNEDFSNFELFYLPRAWTGIFINLDVPSESLSADMTGSLKLDVQK